MQFHDLKRNTKQKKSVQVGRGGKRGKTAGRGTKGQKARAGRKMRPELRDLIKKLPKLRGYSFKSFREKPVVISIEKLEKVFESGATVTRETLLEKGIIEMKKGRTPSVKIVGGKGKSDFSKKLSFTGILFTSGAKSIVEKAGGAVN